LIFVIVAKNREIITTMGEDRSSRNSRVWKIDGSSATNSITAVSPRGLALLFLFVLATGRATLAFQTRELGHQLGDSASARSILPPSPHSRSTARSATSLSSPTTFGVTFEEYLDEQISKGRIDRGLYDVMVAVAESCADVSYSLKTHALKNYSNITTTVNVQGEQQKRMDVFANDIFIRNLEYVNAVAAMASEEEEAVIYGKGNGSSNGNGDNNNASASGGTRSYEIAFDPLDGSGNLDVNLPTGSIFGIAPFGRNGNERPFSRPGSALVASGYALYSSSTELVVSFGNDHPDGVVGFTLDESWDYDERSFVFLLSRIGIRCPPHGPYYSLNEAREPDWPNGLKRWISDAKRGITPTGRTYSSRYVCSLCADLHRTLLEGGWAGNPRPHLRLLYEAAPLAFLIEAAGGRGSDGTKDLLEIEPGGLHDRVCVFLGSKEDIDDLESYGDIQQLQAKRYEA
jgi:fructose-1,6-bisphosphatase I